MFKRVSLVVPPTSLSTLARTISFWTAFISFGFFYLFGKIFSSPFVCHSISKNFIISSSGKIWPTVHHLQLDSVKYRQTTLNWEARFFINFSDLFMWKMATSKNVQYSCREIPISQIGLTGTTPIHQGSILHSSLNSWVLFQHFTSFKICLELGINKI